MDTPSGQMKQIIVDQVESMERPLAHLLPEMTANILGPVCIPVSYTHLDVYKRQQLAFVFSFLKSLLAKAPIMLAFLALAGFYEGTLAAVDCLWYGIATVSYTHLASANTHHST